jgi:integrase
MLSSTAQASAAFWSDGAGADWACGLGQAMRRPVAGAGLSDGRYHDLRHHFASKLVAAGCSVRPVQAALGQDKASTTLDP